MGKPVILSSVSANPPVASVVETLESLLADARAGKITAFVWIAIDEMDSDAAYGGSTGQVWEEAPDMNILMGSLERLKFDLYLLGKE